IPPDLTGPAQAEAYERIKALYGFDRPLHEQYIRYLTRMASLDFGQSLRQKTDVAEDLARRIPNTLQLGLVALLLSMVLGISLGSLPPVPPGSWFHTLTMFPPLFAVSMPSFWLALMLILVFAVSLPILPPSGFAGSVLTPEGLRYTILPAIVLGLGGAGAL